MAEEIDLLEPIYLKDVLTAGKIKDEDPTVHPVSPFEAEPLPLELNGVDGEELKFRRWVEAQ